MALARRFPPSPPLLSPLVKPPTAEEIKQGKDAPPGAGLWSRESFAALQRYLHSIYSSSEGGLPAGQSTIVPTIIVAGEEGTVGDPSTGWATGAHQHEIDTASAISLTPNSPNSEGGGPDLARATHHHDTVQLANAVEMMIDLRV